MPSCQTRARIGGVVVGATLEGGVGLGDDPFEQRQQHRVLGREIEVEGRPGDAGALGEVVDGDLGERPLLEQPFQRCENRQLTVVAGRAVDAAAAGGAGLAGGGHEH